MKAFECKILVYADSEEEVKQLEKESYKFVEECRMQGVAVRAEKLSTALASWQKNIIVKNAIINHLR